MLLVSCLVLAGNSSFAQNDSFSNDSDSAILERSSRALANIVKKARPAVVHITVEKTAKRREQAIQGMEELFNHPFFEQFFGPYYREQRPQQKRDYTQKGQGSGFIISKDGHILTNNHVVEDADIIKVMLSDKREFKARVIGTDPQTDVALIKIEEPSNLPVLPLGDSDKLDVAEWVIAIGNPFGLSQTVTLGVVSATGRSSVGITEYENFIQTDAAINPGNSGGPLLNGRGEVIGINTALFSRTGGYMGIGFAIPINMAKAIEGQLLEFGKVTRGWLGVVIQNMDKDLADSFKLKNSSGILVSEVQPDSPAMEAGLEQGDVILSLNNDELTDVSALRNKIALLRPGTTAKLEIIRDGQNKEIQVTIGQQPDDFGKGGSYSNNTNTLKKYGFSLQELEGELADKFGYEPGSGLIISDVEPGSPAAKAGLKPGHLIETINRQPVKNLSDVNRIMESNGNSKLLLRVRSGNHATYVVLTPTR